MGSSATDRMGALFLLAGVKRERFAASTAAAAKSAPVLSTTSTFIRVPFSSMVSFSTTLPSSPRLRAEEGYSGSIRCRNLGASAEPNTVTPVPPPPVPDPVPVEPNGAPEPVPLPALLLPPAPSTPWPLAPDEATAVALSSRFLQSFYGERCCCCFVNGLIVDNAVLFKFCF